MPIIKSTEIFDDIPAGSRRERRYKITITTNKGTDEVYIESPVVVDVADDGAAVASKKLISLADVEAGRLVDLNPNYQDQRDYDRRGLGRAMTITGTDEFYEVLPLFRAMEARGGANANQRASYLGVTRADYDLMAARFNDVAGIAFFLDDAKGQVWDDVPEGWK